MRPRTSAALSMLLLVSRPAASAASAADHLHDSAHAYYRWRSEQFPVVSSDQGLHTWDDRLTDYSAQAIRSRRDRVSALADQVRALNTDGWSKDDRIDRTLFLAQLEGADFFDRVLASPESDPQVYVGECSNGIFSLLKKEYDAPAKRALAATARLRSMPALLAQGRQGLTRPVRLYARLAIESARSMDSLFGESLMTLAKDLTPTERKALVAARDAALGALRDFAAWLESRLPQMDEFSPMGEEKYNWLLRHVYLLPLDATQVAMLGEAELARYRGLESLLPNPAMADPDPARSASVPKDQQAFLAAYESRQAEMIALPPRQAPRHAAAVPRPVSDPPAPRGVQAHVARRLHERSGRLRHGPGRLLLHPDLRPQEPQLLHPCRHRGPAADPGARRHPRDTFSRSPIANALRDEIRRHHQDGVFVEGWALYTEEMLMRTGLYPEGLGRPRRQILRLSRYRAARIGVDVNLHTGRWTLRPGREVLHGGRRSGSRGRGGRSGRSRLQPVAEDHVHGGEVADPALARQVPRPRRRGFPPGRLPRRAARGRQPAAIGAGVAASRRSLDARGRHAALRACPSQSPISSAIGWSASITKATCSSSGRPTASAPP